MKKIITIILAAVMITTMLLSAAACSSKPTVSSTDTAALQFPSDQYEYKYQWYATLTPEEIVSTLTLEQKAAQMVQPILSEFYYSGEEAMGMYCYGSIYGDSGMYTDAQWREMFDKFQLAAIESEAGIPYAIAQDDVHGVGYCIDAVYFPHNIGQGAANDEQLCYQAGLITAEEARQCHMMWNLYPCVAQSCDPRWGRNYECYSSDLDTISRLSTAYTKGLIDGGVIATAKHFFGDGNVGYGTGENSDYFRRIDRGNSRLDDDEIAALLDVYQAQIDAGVQAIMVSYSSLNGKKMHEQDEYIWKLKNDMGFKGFVMSDYEAIKNTSPETYEEQVISAVNCGIDLLMEGTRYHDAMNIIVGAVKEGKITEDRVDDAVTRIIKVKKDTGIFDDPFCESATAGLSGVGSPEHRTAAEKLVEKSLVLLKNDNEVLPLKEGMKVYITGPAADNARAQCGGWTMGWNQCPTRNIKGVTTIQKAFEEYAGDYGMTVITDPEQAKKADVVLLCVGEDAYAEWFGDAENLRLCGDSGFKSNRKAIDEAKELGKPTVACIIAGRQLIPDEEDYESWDSVVMCYLPGSEGKGISDVLCGCADFTGRLPEPYYGATKYIGTDECMFERGYGLSYGEGFEPRPEPEAVYGTGVPAVYDFGDPMSGTSYTKGVFKDGIYVNEYAGIKLDIPGDLEQIGESDILTVQELAVQQCTNDKDRMRESATITDNVFAGGSGEYISISFINTELGIPDSPDCSEDRYLDDLKAFESADAANYGLEQTYGDRVRVTLGGSDYVRDTYTYNDGTGAVYTYARKIDDKLMCVIKISAFDEYVKPADYYEKLFK